MAKSTSDRAAHDGSIGPQLNSSFVIRHSSLLARHPWLTFLLPFIVYMVVGALRALAAEAADQTARRHHAADHQPKLVRPRVPPLPDRLHGEDRAHDRRDLFVLPGYRQFPFRISPLAIVVGVVGVVLWIWLCHLQFERKLLAPLGLEKFFGLGDRPAYNPLEATGRHARLGVHISWHPLPRPRARRADHRRVLPPRLPDAIRRPRRLVGRSVRQRHALAAIVGTAVPMLMHPAELLAAFVWFSLVTWLMVRTKNIWDCVAAHAVTNLLLGIYVVTQHQWQLW